MIFNKKIQYGLLLALYLSRSGRSKIEAISASLDISKHFLDQVARKLRIAGVIKSTRGPGGGYELVGTPTVKEVFKALGGIPVIKQRDHDHFKVGDTEKRALSKYVSTLKTGLSLFMDTTVKSLIDQSVQGELAQLNSTNPDIRVS